MRAAKLMLAMLAPCLALAQLQLFVVDNGTEKTASSLYTVGQVAAGDKVDITFRVRNVGTAVTNLQTLTLSGVGFSLMSQPILPYSLPAGAMLAFVVRFQPPADGSYSANLAVNSGSTILLGSSLAAATVQLVAGTSTTTLTTGDVVDFGDVQRGTGTTLHFKVLNQNTGQLAIDTVKVTGDGFAGPAGITAPLTLAAAAAASFDVTFTPQGIGQQDGSLQVGAKLFVLRGTGTDPLLPKPQLVIAQQTFSSAQQSTIRVKLSETAQASGTGELQLEFQSLQSDALDPAVQFLSTGSRYATFTVTKGEEWARFDGATQISFQTGSTAGSLVFTAKLGDNSDSVTATVATAAPTIETTLGVRSGSILEVQLSGYDNARSISQLAFTFYNQSGQAIEPGTIHYDATSDFKTYFANSQKDVGGLFSLRAVFVVTGAAADISTVDVAVTNSVGTATPPRISFP
jgi:hypothetical protein